MSAQATEIAARRISALRGRFAAWTIAYALAITYASVVIGPLGFHYVPRDPVEAWKVLIATRFVANGSDQRADWMANLAMIVPLGFLCMGTFWSRRFGVTRLLTTILSLICCLSFVVAVKYAQLYFPPRTVTLNYILAQSIGSAVGIILFQSLNKTLFAPAASERIPGKRALELVLQIYTALLVLYFLFPFDFVLSFEDLTNRINGITHWLLALPGEGRPKGIQLALLFASVVETIPLGILFALRAERPNYVRIALVGFVSMSIATAASMFVMSTTPHLVSIVLRTIGILIGAFVALQMRHVDTAKLQRLLARISIVLIVPYVLGVLYVNGLIAIHWRTIAEARDALDYRGLLPLWHYYIVSKAQAMASLVAHVVMFAPIGIAASLHAGRDRARLAAMIAFAFSFAIELGRWMRPGLEPDFNDAVVAAVSAWLAVKAMPTIWQMIGSLSSRSPLEHDSPTA